MKKKVAAITILAVLLVTMACTISYEGINFGSDPDVEHIEDLTATAEGAQAALLAPAASTQEPQPQPAVSQSEGDSSGVLNGGMHEYSAAATDYDCICQVDGNVTVEFTVKSDQLEFTNPGGVPEVYEKIGENKYKRTFMGYYILDSGSGDQVTSTIVEEERHTMIILNDGGYVMEHYQGSESSSCCYHTFTLIK